MPFYEYQCSSCQHHTEVLQKISDAPLRKCPDCGKAALKRLISAPVFRLKGGGWYETDFKSDQEKKRNLHGADDAAESKPDSKSDTAKESPQPAEAKGEAKGEAKAESKAESKPPEAKTSSAKTSSAQAGSAKTRSAKPKPAARPVKAKASAKKKKR